MILEYHIMLRLPVFAMHLLCSWFCLFSIASISGVEGILAFLFSGCLMSFFFLEGLRRNHHFSSGYFE